MSCRSRLWLAAAFIGAACTEGAGPADRSFELERLAAYGRSGMDERVPGPDVLADPAAAIAVDGDLVVLDRRVQRVVRLSAGGRVVASGGRRGRGPGEFVTPIHASWRGDSAVSVLDYDGGRITTFDEDSLTVMEVISGVPGRGFFHQWWGDTVWVTRPLEGGDRPIATGYLASDPSKTFPGPLPVAADVEFGGGSGLAKSDTRLLVGTRRPGVWWQRVEGGWARVGTPLFPDAPPEGEREVGPQLTAVVPSPAQSHYLTILGDSLVLQQYVLWPGIHEADDPFNSDIPRELYLGVFEVDGDYLGSVALDGEIHCLEAAPAGEVLVCTRHPYPQVHRFKLR